MITGVNAYICNECVERAHEICEDALQQAKAGVNNYNLDKKNLPKPQDIKDFLDQYVIGQESAFQIHQTSSW